MTILIDELPGTALPSLEHEFPTMKEGATVKLTVAQVLELVTEHLLGDDPNFSTTLAVALATLTGLVNDPWQSLPIGVPMPLFSNLVGITLPPKDKAYRYIRLTAGEGGVGGYNEGVLVSESITGSAPLVNAVSTISLIGSPLNGQVVQLINTERRFLRAGFPGIVENDQQQDHHHTGNRVATYAAGGTSQALAGRVGNDAGINPYTSDSTASRTTDGAGGTGTRIGTETRPKNIGATYYMRIK